MTRFAAVICGAGIAGAEAALRLHRLAGDSVAITLLDPRQELVYRPLAVRAPFARGGARRYSLAAIAERIGATLIGDRAASVDRDARTVHLAGGRVVPYDALLLAPGGREVVPFENAHVFSDRNADETYHGIVQDIETGYITSLVLIEPEGPTWPLPLYELALMTAERADSMNATCEITFVTARRRPLQAFGGGASEAVERLFADAGITLHANATAQVPARRHVVIEPEGVQLHPQRIVTLPRIAGASVPGVPTVAPHGFFPINRVCEVRDTGGRVFAAGDSADFPVKHGGIGAQQADTAAAGVAHLAGTAPPPAPFEPVVRGMLLTGAQPLYLTAHLFEGRGWHTELYDQPPWPADEKVVAEELGPLLASLEETAPRP
jgi:sulfide:quinone oxidoreductase